MRNRKLNLDYAPAVLRLKDRWAYTMLFWAVFSHHLGCLQFSRRRKKEGRLVRNKGLKMVSTHKKKGCVAYRIGHEGQYLIL